jgi:hypothetical protein
VFLARVATPTPAVLYSVRCRTTTLNLETQDCSSQIDGGGLRGLVPAGMLEGVEDMIKTVAKERGLVGVAEDGKTQVPVTSDTNFSVVLADYFNVVAGESLHGMLQAQLLPAPGLQQRDVLRQWQLHSAGTSTGAIVATYGE